MFVSLSCLCVTSYVPSVSLCWTGSRLIEFFTESAFAERKECRPSCLQHGHTVYCQTCRTVPNSPPSPPLECLVLHLSSPDATVFSRLFFCSFLTSFSSSSSFKASEDGQVVSSSCVSSCLVSWCACSCQYLCLLWIACFSPWLDTNVAHKLLLTLMWTNVGDPYKNYQGNQITYYKFIICVTSSVKKQIGNKGLLITMTCLCLIWSVFSSASS